MSNWRMDTELEASTPTQSEETSIQFQPKDLKLRNHFTETDIKA